MTLKISYCKLDLTANIIDFNQNFSTLFDVPKETKLSLLSYFNLNKNFLYQIKLGDRKSFILFYNTKINNAVENNALMLMYAVVVKSDNYYTVHFTNWLNWIHGISGSLENSYSLITEFNDNTKKTEFTTISDAACFKALYPLLSYLPNKSSNGISQASLFDILRVFVRLRETNFSRDYARNVYSRVRTSLRKEYGHDYIDVIDLIKNNDLVNINYGSERLIPNTILASNIMYPIEQDNFLLTVINSIAQANI